MENLVKQLQFAFGDSEESLVDTESFLKSALSIAQNLEEHEEFDEEFLAICSQYQTSQLSGHF